MNDFIRRFRNIDIENIDDKNSLESIVQEYIGINIGIAFIVSQYYETIQRLMKWKVLGKANSI